MRASRRSLFPFAAVALSTWTVSCHQPQSVLLVEVAGDLSLSPASFSVTVTPARTAQRTFFITPPSAGSIALPASFTVELPGSITGPVNVAVVALDPLGFLLASGMTTQQNLDIGGQTIVVVTLVDSSGVTPPEPDAGQGGVDAQPPADAQVQMDAHAGMDARPDGAHDAGRTDGPRHDGSADGAHRADARGDR